MDKSKNARRDGRAKDTNIQQDRGIDRDRQAQRPPRPETIKASIDPAEFYRCEIDHLPALKTKGDDWSHNFGCPFHDDEHGSFGILYQAARAKHPERWSGSTRNWQPAATVFLNPGKPSSQRAHLAAVAA